MFWTRQHERALLEDQDPSAARRVLQEESVGHHGAEGPTADNNDIKVPALIPDILCGGIDRLLQRVAEEPAHVVEGERRGLGAQQRGHERLPSGVSAVHHVCPGQPKRTLSGVGNL